MTRLVRVGLAVATVLSLAACASKDATHDGWSHYGADTDAHALPQIAIGAIRGMPAGEGAPAKLEGTILEVCTIKGCWMTMRDAGGEEVLVRFKDYGFFVPRNAMGRTAWVTGVPQRQTLSVEALRHLAEDAGRTPAEIAAITEPEDRLMFLADAVWIQGGGLQAPYRPVGQENCPSVDGGSTPAK
jgi:hypothetical protein